MKVPACGYVSPVPKRRYVTAGSGVFSDRTCAYPASSLPEVIRNPEWTDWLSTNEGPLFCSMPEEVTGADIRSDSAEHSHAALHLAAEHFRATEVLRDFQERAS